MGDNYDFGKSMGDDMVDADLVSLDGIGMGGEFSEAGRDTADVDKAVKEAEMTFEDGSERFGFGL